jgi:adenylylsulfate kinase-like enzyme
MSGEKEGLILWVTGLSDSGKTTLCEAARAILQRNSIPCIVLDGDQIRRVFDDTHGYDLDTRRVLALRVAKLAKELSSQGYVVLVGIIGLIKEVHEWNLGNQRNFFLTLLNIPVEELKKRDSKGLYTNFELGSVSSMYGLDLPAHFPPVVDLEFTMMNIGDPNANAKIMLKQASRQFGKITILEPFRNEEID